MSLSVKSWLLGTSILGISICATSGISKITRTLSTCGNNTDVELTTEKLSLILKMRLTNTDNKQDLQDIGQMAFKQGANASACSSDDMQSILY